MLGVGGSSGRSELRIESPAVAGGAAARGKPFLAGPRPLRFVASDPSGRRLSTPDDGILVSLDDVLQLLECRGDMAREVFRRGRAWPADPAQDPQ